MPRTGSPRVHATRPRAARVQRGVYSLEFAMVFLLFFALIYTIVCYAIVFTFRFGLQNAAEDGARAAVRYQPSLEQRRLHAQEVALARTRGWLPVEPEVRATVLAQGPLCDATAAGRCSVQVTVQASGLNRVLPPLAGLVMPDVLRGQAQVLLDGRAL